MTKISKLLGITLVIVGLFANLGFAGEITIPTLPDGTNYVAGTNQVAADQLGTTRRILVSDIRAKAVWAKDYGTFALANAAATAAGNTDIVVDEATTLTQGDTIAATNRLVVTGQGSVALAGYTLVVSGKILAGPFTIFTGSGTVTYAGPVSAEWFGFSPSATAANNLTYLTRAFATGSTYISVQSPGNYSYDNTSPTTISTSNLTVKLDRGVNIQPTVQAKVFLITGANVTWDGGTMTGDGTYVTTAVGSGRPRAFIEVTDDSDADGTVTLGYAQNTIIKNVVMVNPPDSGILFYRTVGGKVSNCNITSAYSGSAVVGAHFGVYIYSSARISVTDGTVVDGFHENICGGGTASYTFDDYAGTSSSSNTRNIMVSDSHLFNYRDHAVYFASNSEKVTVDHNQMRTKWLRTDINTIGPPVKLYGGGNIVSNNEYVGEQGFFTSSKALWDSSIIGNNATITGDYAYIYGIYIAADADTDHDVENLVIANNNMVATADTGPWLWIYGYKYTDDGTQNLIKNITIAGNTAVGFGNEEGITNRSLIQIITEAATGTSYWGKNIAIVGNTLSGPALCGIYLSGSGTQTGYDNATIVGNTIEGITTSGSAMKLCVKNSLIDDNTYRPAVANSGIREVSYTGVTEASNNWFGKFNVLSSDIATGRIFVVAENDTITPLPYYYSASLTSDTSLGAYMPYAKYIVNPTADRAITLTSTSAAVFTVGYTVEVHNISATYNVTFELSSGGSTVTVGPQTSKTFMCVGSNTFIDIY